jgi:uncharacterized protein YdhG (YjbR/CyaY superfamily)
MTNTAQRSAATSPAESRASGFTAAERTAMKERAEELRLSGRGGKKKADDARALLAKIAEMPEADRALAERVHAIVASAAPSLSPKTWYGMPAYADRTGKVVVYFQAASKFGSRYSTLGFNDSAQLDDGSIWPTSYAITSLTRQDVDDMHAIVQRAAG